MNGVHWRPDSSPVDADTTTRIVWTQRRIRDNLRLSGRRSRPTDNLEDTMRDMRTNDLHDMLSLEARRVIFQALCTERDRLDSLGLDSTVASALTETYAAALVADECCGRLKVTHAYCDSLDELDAAMVAACQAEANAR